MARVGQVVQQPAEVRLYTLEYSDFLNANFGEQLTGIPVVEVSPTTSPALIVTAQIIPTTQVRLEASGGVEGTRYKVETRVNTSMGQIKEDELIIAVRDY